MGTQEGRGNRRLCEIASLHLETSGVSCKADSVGSILKLLCDLRKAYALLTCKRLTEVICPGSEV